MHISITAVTFHSWCVRDLRGACTAHMPRASCSRSCCPTARIYKRRRPALRISVDIPNIVPLSRSPALHAARRRGARALVRCELRFRHRPRRRCGVPILHCGPHPGRCNDPSGRPERKYRLLRRPGTCAGRHHAGAGDSSRRGLSSHGVDLCRAVARLCHRRVFSVHPSAANCS